MKDIAELVQTLKRHENVTGLIEYGGRSLGDDDSTGDYDLLAVLKTRNPAVNSLHFDVGDVPVDLNLLSESELAKSMPGDSFEVQAVIDGRIIYDPTGSVSELQDRLVNAAPFRRLAVSAHTVAFIRHGHRHLLDKVKDRMQSMPTLCQVLLNTNVYWLLENYFQVRGRPFRGPKIALTEIREKESKLYGLIEAFYAATDLHEKLSLSQSMTEIVLAPVGGTWRKGEVLAFGPEDAQDLQDQGRAVYEELFRR